MAVEQSNNVLEDMGNEEDIFFKPFEETFNILMFSMVFGMIYPNPKTEKWRILAVFVYILVMFPVILLLIYDGQEAYKEGDFDSIFRHTIVMGPFMAHYLKMVLMYIHRTKAKEVLEEMNEYFVKLNSKPLSLKLIAKKWLNRSFFLEKSWSYFVLAGSFSFPITAICKNTYSTLFEEQPRKFFIHDLRSPFGSKFDFPFYEMLFINTCFASCMYFLNFTGYDGFFVQLILHAVMRIAVCGEALKDAFKIDNTVLRRKAVRAVIDDHIAICKFMDSINEIFEQWMTVVTFAWVIHLCSCVFYLSKGNGLQDVEFLSATFGAIAYLYMICACAGLIQEKSEKLADTFYQCGWERVPDSHCRCLLLVMIVRAQKPFQVTTKAFYNVNLQLLVRILKMAYSLLTFLQQT